MAKTFSISDQVRVQNESSLLIRRKRAMNTF